MESVYDSTAWQYGAEVLNGDTREVLVLAFGLRLGLGDSELLVLWIGGADGFAASTAPLSLDVRDSMRERSDG